jgi:AcrR family transcriptional regulator
MLSRHRAGLKVEVVRALYVDKEALLREIMRQETEPMVSAIALAVEKIADPREVVKKSLAIFDQWMFDHRQLVRIWQRCALESAETLSAFLEKSLMPSDFFEHLEDLINKGQIRCTDLLVLGILFDSLIVFPHMMRAALELACPEGTVAQLFERRFSAIIDLLEHGLYTQK